MPGGAALARAYGMAVFLCPAALRLHGPTVWRFFLRPAALRLRGPTVWRFFYARRRCPCAGLRCDGFFMPGGAALARAYGMAVFLCPAALRLRGPTVWRLFLCPAALRLHGSGVWWVLNARRGIGFVGRVRRSRHPAGVISSSAFPAAGQALPPDSPGHRPELPSLPGSAPAGPGIVVHV